MAMANATVIMLELRIGLESRLDLQIQSCEPRHYRERPSPQSTQMWDFCAHPRTAEFHTCVATLRRIARDTVWERQRALDHSRGATFERSSVLASRST